MRDLANPGQPLARMPVEHEHLRAVAQAHDVAEIVRLAGVHLDRTPSPSGCRTNRRGRLFGGQAGVAGISPAYDIRMEADIPAGGYQLPQ